MRLGQLALTALLLETVASAGINEERKLQPEIIDGEDAVANRYPYFAAIVDAPNKNRCGGSLICKDWVLTAAHCIDVVLGNPILIGELDNTNYNNGGQNRDLRYADPNVIIHPRYDGYPKHGWDVALVRLDSPSALPTVKFDDGTSQASLAGGDPLDTIGFGTISTTTIFNPSRLKTVEINLVPQDTCSAQWIGEATITDSMICAQGSGQGSCKGDSGGPLLSVGPADDGSDDVVVGITSFGPDPLCGDANQAAVYTRVGIPDIVDWINLNTNNCNAKSLPEAAPSVKPTKKSGKGRQ